jgi:hypothetical protein
MEVISMKSSLRLISRVLVIALAATLVPAHVLAMEEVRPVGNPLINAIRHNLQANLYPNINENMRRIFNDQNLTDAELIDGIHQARDAFAKLSYWETGSLGVAVVAAGLNPLATKELLNLDNMRAITDNAQRNQAIHLCLHTLNDYLQVGRISELLENHLQQAHQAATQRRAVLAAQFARQQTQTQAQDARAQADEAVRADEQAREALARTRARRAELQAARAAREAEVARLQIEREIAGREAEVARVRADVEARATENRALAQAEARLAAEQRAAEAKDLQAQANRVQEAIAKDNQQRAAFAEQERQWQERERAREARVQEEARLAEEQEAAEQQARIAAEREAEATKAQEELVTQENLVNIENPVQQNQPEAQARPAPTNDFASRLRERYEREQAEAARVKQEQEVPQPVHPMIAEPVMDEDLTEEDSDNESDNAQARVVPFIDAVLERIVPLLGDNPVVEPAQQQPVAHEQVRTPREPNPVFVNNAPPANPIRNDNNQEGQPARQPAFEVPPVVLVNNPDRANDEDEELVRLEEQERQEAAQAERARQAAEHARQEAEQANQRAQEAAAQPQPAAAAQGAPAPVPAAEGGLVGMLKNLWDTIKGKAQENPKIAATIGIAAAFGLYKLISWFMSDDKDDEDADDAAPIANPVSDEAQPEDQKAQERSERPVKTTTTASDETQESRNLAAKRKRAQLRREFLKKRGRCCKSRCKKRCR